MWARAALAAILVAAGISLGNVELGNEPGWATQKRGCEPSLTIAIFMRHVHEIEIGNVAVYPKVICQRKVQSPAFCVSKLDKKVYWSEVKLPIATANYGLGKWQDAFIGWLSRQTRADKILKADACYPGSRLADVDEYDGDLGIIRRPSVVNPVQIRLTQLIIRRAGFIQFDFSDVDAGQFDADSGLGAELGGPSGVFGSFSRSLGDYNRSLQIPSLFGSIVEKPGSKNGQDSIEQDQEPIGNVVIPMAFLASFFCAIAAARRGGKLAAWIVGAFGFGWLALIVYFGLL